MSFSIEWDEHALKSMKKLPEKISERIFKKVESIKDDPFRYLQHYEGAKVYKLRIGDYRALLDVDFDNKVITVQVLDKRGKIYK